MGFRNVIVGSGVAALATALVAAAHGPVLLLVRAGFRWNVPVRIDSVPAQAIATLIELGVDPRKFSDLRRHRTRLTAWSTAEPVAVHGPETVHVERGNLEAALFEQVIRHPRITLLPAPVGRAALLAFLAHPRLRGALVVDASGRAAVLARTRYRVPGGWLARTVLVDVRKGTCDEDLRIAATPDGFGYRLGLGQRLTLGQVSFRMQRPTGCGEPFESLRREHAFLFEGTPPLSAGAGLRVYPAAPQCAFFSGAIAVGDAALARDALSSQGLACAISEAHYASAVSTPRDAMLLRRRSREQRTSHLRSLTRMLADSRYTHETGWARYQQHLSLTLAATLGDEPPAVGLRHGRLRSSARQGTWEPGHHEEGHAS